MPHYEPKVNIPQPMLTHSIETAWMNVARRAVSYEALLDALHDEFVTVNVGFLAMKPDYRGWVSVDRHGVRHEHLTEIDAIMAALQHYIAAKCEEAEPTNED